MRRRALMATIVEDKTLALTKLADFVHALSVVPHIPLLVPASPGAIFSQVIHVTERGASRSEDRVRPRSSVVVIWGTEASMSSRVVGSLESGSCKGSAGCC